MSEKQGPLGHLFAGFKAGTVSRRNFLEGALKLGVAAPVALHIMNAVTPATFAQDAAAASAPASGTEGQTRGAGGELKLIQWQGATHFGLHTATGTKDQLAASLVLEPLMSFLPDGTFVPTLAAEVPTFENGGLAEDLTWVQYKLKPGVLWSDGTPFTAADVVFTWQWVAEPANGATTGGVYAVVSNVEAIDDLTVKVTFKSPQLGWSLVFTGSYNGSIYPKHILEAGGEAYNAFMLAPIGTGGFKVDSFSPNDQAILSANENYREPNKPFFATVNVKGGGDSTSAAQAVMETGDWDFAWNLQSEPTILRDLEANGVGSVKTGGRSNLEAIYINFCDPSSEVDGQRAEKNTPHPFLTDINVRQAISYATDRDTISAQFYLGGDQEPGSPNFLTGIAALESPNTTYEFSLEKAAALLDSAGWVMDGDTRKKDGVELKISYSTSINSIRQKTQALNKQNFESIGFSVNLKQVDAGIFFDSAPGNEQNFPHFYTDIEMYTSGPTSTTPLSYMEVFYAGADGANIAQKSNQWSGTNISRYQNAEYDALYEAAQAETDPETLAGLFIQMNDHVITNFVNIPEVARASEKYAIINTLNNDNIAGSLFEALYWNAANWNRVS